MNDLHSLDEQLTFAIAHKRLIQFRYNGRLRVAEPHDYGIKNGTRKLLVYQIREAGGDQRQRIRGWRLVEASKIDACRVLDDQFRGSRGRSSDHHMMWDTIFIRVA
jgi:hypothetical protein